MDGGRHTLTGHPKIVGSDRGLRHRTDDRTWPPVKHRSERALKLKGRGPPCTDGPPEDPRDVVALAYQSSPLAPTTLTLVPKEASVVSFNFRGDHSKDLIRTKLFLLTS